MKSWKKIVSLLLAVLMVSSMASIALADDAAPMKVAIVRWTDSWGTDFTQTAFLKEISEATGVNIEWDTYYNGDWAEQKSLLLASGELPAAFFGSISLTDTDIAQNEAFFVDLAPYIEECMPNLSAIFAADPTMKAMCTTRDGKIYGLPKKLPLRPTSANELYINKVWLDKLGLAMPTTYAELEDVLKHFVADDPNGNGIADEVGYSNAASALNDMNNLLLPFGTQASRANNYMGLNAEGKPYFVPTADNYKDAVKWANQLYTEGLLDAERFTMDNNMVNAKKQAEGGSLVGMFFGWTADAEAAGNKGEFVVCPAPAGPDGQRWCETDPTFLNYGKNELVVTTACTDVKAMLKWADQFYTDLASLQTYYGSIADGKIAAKDDGAYEVLLPTDGMSLDTSCWQFSFRDHGPKYMTTDFESKIVLPTTEGDGIKLADDAANAGNFHDNFPVVTYTNEQLTEMATMTTDLYGYVEQMYAHWVVDGGIDEEWDAYITQLNTMGLERLVEIQLDAYNAYVGA